MKRILFFISLSFFFLICLGCQNVQLVTSAIDDAGIQYYLSADKSEYAVSFEHVTTSSVDVPSEYKGKPVTTVAYSMFYSSEIYDYAPIQEIALPSSITTLEDYAFFGWYHLETIMMSENITFIGKGAFLDRYELQEITIPEGVTEIQAFTFSYCERLESVSILGTITTIGEYAFSRCLMLSDFTLPEGLLIIDKGAFFMCSSLLNILFPSTLVSIGNYAFSECDLLESATLPSGIEEIGIMAFYRDPLLTTFILPETNQYFTFEDGVLFNKDQTTLIFYLQSNTFASYIVPSSVTVISNKAFYDNDYLESITLPVGLLTIESMAFAYLANLSDINFPSTLTTIEDSAFRGCNGLESVVLPSSVTSIGSYAFANCQNLSSIVLSQGLLSIGHNAFTSSIALTDILIPASVNFIGEQAFLGCNSLVNILVNSNNITYSSIDGILYDKDIQTIIVYPEAKETTSFTIPASVTEISSFCFSNQHYLVNLYIPTTVTTISDSAFYECPNLIIHNMNE